MKFIDSEAEDIIETWDDCPSYNEIIKEYPENSTLQTLYPGGNGFIPERHVLLTLRADIASTFAFARYALAHDIHPLGDSDTAYGQGVFDRGVLLEMGIKYKRDNFKPSLDTSIFDT